MTKTLNFKNYLLLTKPGIIMGNCITAFGGFALASKGQMHFGKLFAMLFGLSFIIASGCVFNNYIDRKMDQKMIRTKNRALAKGIISIQNALIYGFCLAVFGAISLSLLTNMQTTLIAIFGLLFYVLIYSFAKYRTLHGTLIGSIAGAVPPLVGFSAAANRLDFSAFILFAVIALWQMPHFFAISIYRLKEYQNASIPVLPAVRGILNTKVQMLLYTLAFMFAVCLLFLQGYVGISFLIALMVLSSIWLGMGVRGFKAKNDSKWARQMFVFSLVIVMALSTLIPLSVS
ncbi:MAG: heme o synthase [Simkaniaceae bacterium]|nr:heme o synthase [Simkaniaceae bacterium]